MKNINIIGYGINALEHLTLRAIKDLEDSEVVLTLANNEEIDILSKYCKKIISIKPLYKDGDKDTDNYYRIYKKTISYLSDCNNVSLLIAGHPRIGVTLTQLFELQSKKENFTVSVNPGISSFDTMLNDLKIDPLEEGTVIVDVNRLLLFDHPMNTGLNYFIYHISSIGNRKTDMINPRKNNNIDVLKKHLLKFYAPSKTIHMVQSGTMDRAQSVIKQSCLDDIITLLCEGNFMCSLFINADENRKPINHEFYNLIS